jgi:N-acetyl-1-D-myo-inositol-2-amino-2-deoxy-alpha-D-glucopyranoside deacetylase
LVSSRAGEDSLLLVHAHPDDESIGTGATMAKYAASGARVTLVTCTLGEAGEIIPPDLAHLLPDELGVHRVRELADACSALGVTDHRFLGGPGRYRDSGMMGTEENEDPRCFWQASVASAADELAKIIDEVRPSVIVTYDAEGLYGHPDHIQAHRVAWEARRLAAPNSRFYAIAMPASAARAAAELPPDSWFTPAADVTANTVPDAEVTTAVDGSAYLDAKIAAMTAHATQITVDGLYFALSDNVGRRVLGVEHYIQLAGPDAAPASDLFLPGEYEKRSPRGEASASEPPRLLRRPRRAASASERSLERSGERGEA